MRIIAVETSGRHGSIAALAGEAGDSRLIQQVVLNGEQRIAQALAPALRDLLSDIGWLPQSIGLVGVTVGPGSFTGLRIGVTAAKTFAYAVSAETIGINSLVALANQAPTAPSPLWTILDAQRRELFVARFEPEHQGSLPTDFRVAIVSEEAWIAGVKPGDRVMGPPLRNLTSRLPDGVIVEPEELWHPTAAAVGRVAWRDYQAGRRDDLWKLAPHYYRPSYAEEKAARGEEQAARIDRGHQ